MIIENKNTSQIMGSVFVRSVLRIEENDELLRPGFYVLSYVGHECPARFKEPLYSGSASNKARAIP